MLGPIQIWECLCLSGPVSQDYCDWFFAQRGLTIDPQTRDDIVNGFGYEEDQGVCDTVFLGLGLDAGGIVSGGDHRLVGDGPQGNISALVALILEQHCLHLANPSLPSPC